MCDDCKSIADEYAELLTRRTQTLLAAERIANDLSMKLERERRLSAMWESLAKRGMPEIITAWMDSQVKA
jgi:hypothetical protein